MAQIPTPAVLMVDVPKRLDSEQCRINVAFLKSSLFKCFLFWDHCVPCGVAASVLELIRAAYERREGTPLDELLAH